MKILDRLVILAYIRSFLFCLFSLLSLYVVIDLFTNLDDFFNDWASSAGCSASAGFTCTVPPASSTGSANRSCAGRAFDGVDAANNELPPLLSRSACPRPPPGLHGDAVSRPGRC